MLPMFKPAALAFSADTDRMACFSQPETLHFAPLFIFPILLQPEGCVCVVVLFNVAFLNGFLVEFKFFLCVGVGGLKI